MGVRGRRTIALWVAEFLTLTTVVVLSGQSGAPAAGTGPVIAAAGDIACDPADVYFNGGAGTSSRCRMGATSDLLVNLAPDAVLALGDEQYEAATTAGFAASYDPSWGRLNPVIHPVPGNHEYLTAGAAGYFGYFGALAGSPTSGWHSFDLGDWHIVALNSNCGKIGGCFAGSPQEKWLKADLAAHPASCTLAYWHHPRVSSGDVGNNKAVAPLFKSLYNAGADVVLNGHSHNYERFAPLDPNGVVDQARGLREFVVGTGGRSLGRFTVIQPGSQVRSRTYGVLKLTLRSGAYDWQFVPVPGKSFTDSGTATCH